MVLKKWGKKGASNEECCCCSHTVWSLRAPKESCAPLEWSSRAHTNLHLCALQASLVRNCFFSLAFFSRPPRRFSLARFYGIEHKSGVGSSSSSSRVHKYKKDRTELGRFKHRAQFARMREKKRGCWTHLFTCSLVLSLPLATCVFWSNSTLWLLLLLEKKSRDKLGATITMQLRRRRRQSRRSNLADNLICVCVCWWLLPCVWLKFVDRVVYPSWNEMKSRARSMKSTRVDTKRARLVQQPTLQSTFLLKHTNNSLLSLGKKKEQQQQLRVKLIRLMANW